MGEPSAASRGGDKRTNLEKLARLSNTGTRVESGRLFNLFHKPSPFSAPPQTADDAPSRRAEKKPFSAADSAAVFRLLDAAEEEGITGNAPFQYLESTRPTHSWQSYENHYRKSKSPATTRSIKPYDAAFPNLVRADRHEPTRADQAGECEESGEIEEAKWSGIPTEDAGVRYSDLGVTSIRSLLRHLGLFGVDELDELIRLPCVVGAYVEYREAVFDRAAANLADGPDEDLPQDASGAALGQTPHRWKISHAQLMAETRSPRFTHPRGPSMMDKSSWSVDDHDVRFIVRLYLDTVAGRTPWTHLLGLGHRSDLCERIHWLLIWFRSLHTRTTGTSQESLRVQQLKDQYRSMLPQRQAGPASSSPSLQTGGAAGTRSAGGEELPLRQVGPSSTAARRGPARPGDPAPPRVALPPSRGKEDGSSSGSARPQSRPQSSVAPRPRRPGPPLQQGRTSRGDSWVTQQAWQVFQNQQAVRLASWGVDQDHTGTCVLVPDTWAEQNPRDLLDNITTEDLPANANLEKRLHFHLHDMTTTWARAAVWFNHSERTAEDLDLFVRSKGDKKDGPHMHASHLCHQGFCINPNHLVYESRESNWSRTLCMHTAQGFRAHGVVERLPETCAVHSSPPCMMHHAALTITEAMSLQFEILRKALKREHPPTASTLARPSSHPAYYGTFETSFPLTLPLTAVRYSEGDLREPPQNLNHGSHFTMEKFTVSCPFCPNARRRWQKITAFWSHLRVQHGERPHADLLETIRASTETYTSWADRRFYDLAHHNTNTWQKMEQVMSEAFSWEVVQGWRLPQDRLYEGRATPVDSGTASDID